ncbi:MAG: DUF72 domain-containing protein [Chloroflexi bacterium]|nr:DUF72 domain-containing protein [Chloroflexota bacterium]
MGDIVVGTSSWADPTLLKAGTFYPPETMTPQARLRYYSSNFSLVEVDSSYYAMPAQIVAGKWAQWTPSNFIFDVKAFRLFTGHPTPGPSLPRDIRLQLPASFEANKNIYLKDVPAELAKELWHRFENALLPLDSAGKLGVVSFQFPPWFVPSKANISYIAGLGEHLPQYKLSVEFRTASWLDERHRNETFALLRDNGLACVCVDEPQGFRSSVPPVIGVTSDISVVRFHGRNASTWEEEGLTAAERFNYLYSEKELQEWAPRLKELSSRATHLHVLFNNCFGDKAVVNARQLKLMLGLSAPEQALLRPALI